MRILQVAEFSLFGGQQTAALGCALAQASAGHDVYVCDPVNDAFSGIGWEDRVTTWGGKPGKVDVVHTWGSAAMPASLRADVWAHTLCGVTAALQRTHWIARPSSSSTKGIAVERKAVAHADVVIACSPAVEGQARRWYGVPGKMSVLPFGWSDLVLRPLKREPKLAQLVGFVGRRDFVKGADRARKIADQVLKQLPQARYAEISSAPWLSTWECLHQLDVLLVPSRYDGFNIVALEALAAGCIPILTDSCGLTSLGGVRNWQNCIILKDAGSRESRLIGEMADAAIRLLSNADERKAIAEQASALVKQLRWSQLAPHLQMLYEGGPSAVSRSAVCW